MIKVLITGSGGMLGKDIFYLFSEDKNFIVYGLDKLPLEKLDNQIAIDLLDENSLRKTLEKIKPDIIIHCAAMVNVDECEKNKKSAFDLNVRTTDFLSQYQPLNTKFVYISTDSVFDGQTGNYSEESSPNPLNYYAITKLEGEKCVQKNNRQAIILRTNIYGFHHRKGNSLVEWAIENFRNNQSVNGFTDVIFNPVYTKQLARIIKLCLEKNFTGILNVASDSVLSKYDFLIKLADAFGYSSELVKKTSVDLFNFTASRPKNTCLNVQKLKKIFGLSISFDAGMEELKNDYQKKFTSIRD
jgi:dTDP-4-dehydrorhamnose reductase